MSFFVLAHDTVTTTKNIATAVVLLCCSLIEPIRKLDLLLPATDCFGQRRARDDNRWRLRLAGLIEEQGLADVLDLGNGAFQVKGLREHDLEDLWQRVSVAFSEICDEGCRPFAR
jgi:hypothetical protein